LKKGEIGNGKKEYGQVLTTLKQAVAASQRKEVL